MSTRERWIVYPLLFLTLGIAMRVAMRDKYFPPSRLQIEEIAAGQIRCNQLQVAQLASANGVAARSIQCGQLAVTGPNGQPTVVLLTDPRTKGGLVETLSSTGVPLVILQPIDSGGAVITLDSRKKGGAVSPEKPSEPHAVDKPAR